MRKFFRIGIWILWVATPGFASDSLLHFPPEAYNRSDRQDGAILKSSEGLSLKVRNTDFQKGLLIEKEGQWVPHGLHYEFTGGKMILQVEYRRGKREGVYRKYTLLNGESVLETEGSYLGGKKNGEWKRYDRGILLQRMFYVEDQLNGTFTEYRTSGEMRGKTAYTKEYRNGKLHGETLIYSSTNGNLLQRILYKENTVMRRVEYDESTGMELREISFESDRSP